MDLLVDQANSVCGASPVVFGPCTLGRTWGTRPITFDFLTTFDLFAGTCLNYAGSEISNRLISPTIGP
jgi:hypothetical protein